MHKTDDTNIWFVTPNTHLGVWVFICKKIILCNFDGRPNKTNAQIRKYAGAEVNFYIMVANEIVKKYPHTKELQVNFYTMVANQIVKIYPHTKQNTKKKNCK